MSAARVRIYAQIGDTALLHQLADVEVNNHAEVPDLLRTIADEYGNQRWAGVGVPKLPGIPET